jgi:hypothetical protein
MHPRLLRCWFVALASTLSSFGCGGTTSVTNVVGPDIPKCQMSVTGVPSTVPSSATRVTGTIATERECVWSATSTAAWLKVSPSSGQGEGTLTITVAENSSRSKRSGAIVVNDRRVTLTQAEARAPAPPSPNPTPNPSPNPSPSPSPDPSPSPSPDPSPSPSPNPSPACSVDLDPESRSFSAAGGQGFVEVNAPDACTWSASARAGWISITSAARETGSAILHYRVAPNSTTAERVGTIIIAGHSHVIRQAGMPSPPSNEGEQVDFSGRVSSLAGSCPNIRFSADRYSVSTSDRTRFSDGKCRDIRNGTEVRVTGEIRSGVVLADRVRIEEED